MVVYRLMSEQELADYSAGFVIRGRCDMQRYMNSSVLKQAVCFFGNASNCAHWGMGKSGMYICKFFIPSRYLEVNHGYYPDLTTDDWSAITEVREYATEWYSRDNAFLLGYGIPDGYEDIEFFGNGKHWFEDMYATYGD